MENIEIDTSFIGRGLKKAFANIEEEDE